MTAGDFDSCGWLSDLPTFSGTEPRIVRLRLESFVRDASAEQVRAWDDSIPFLQRECDELVVCDPGARTFTAILEYQLPLESRRPDVIVLENGVVVVLEVKGKDAANSADLDQTHAYARDLRCYHAECETRDVIPVLVPTRMRGVERVQDGVVVASPDRVHHVLLRFARTSRGSHLTPEAFLRGDAYAPLPTLVRAARDLFEHGELPRIKRARAATDPAVERISSIAREAQDTGTRRLVLVTGVPGAGKTLVGLRAVHARELDGLAVARAGERPRAPAVFLSGNGPLVQVLQDALKDAGGGGKTFVRGVKDYVQWYTKRPKAVPPEHLVVFDEAQRAWDAAQVERKHSQGEAHGRSETEHFIEFCERIPQWCVVVGLIGGGQEIHAGEWGGLVEWRHAIEGARSPSDWTVHAPVDVERRLCGSNVRTRWEPALHLDTEIGSTLPGASTSSSRPSWTRATRRRRPLSPRCSGTRGTGCG